MPDAGDDRNGSDRSRPAPDDVYESMEPLEPYTTGELAELLDRPRRAVRRVLDALFDDDRIRKKEPEPGRAIWIREPPVTECPECGRRFEIKYLHPVLSAVRFCPRCGTRVS